jgi:superfamily II DNA or RNA helicase
VDAGGVADATGHLPAELIEMGVDPSHIVSVTSNDADALQKIDAFAKSDAWILATVNMVSEGVDIPVLSAEVFLTSITAKSTTVQRIGRAIRGEGTALIFMFKHPSYLEFALEIENGWKYEVDIRKRKEAAERDGDREWTPPQKREPVGIDAWSDGYTVNSIYLDETERQIAIEALRAQNLPRTADNIALISKLIKVGAYRPDLEPEAVQ